MKIDPEKQLNRTIDINQYLALAAFVIALTCAHEGWMASGWRWCAWCTGTGVALMVGISAIIRAAAHLGFKWTVDSVAPMVKQLLEEAKDK